MENLRKVRIAIIGTGNMGRQYAEMIVDGKVPLMELTAVTARSSSAKAWAAERLPGSVSRFASSEELFTHPDLYDSVLVVTPHPAHYEDVMRAFSLGKDVFCDKPVSQSLTKARAMTEEAKRCGRTYAVMFHQRLYSKYVHVHQVIQSGILGKLLRASVENSEAFRTAAYHHSSPWRSSWAGEGGGCLINQAQHPLDIYCWLFGMPDRVYANVRFGKYNDFLVDDEAMIVMDYENGFTGTFFYTTGEAPREERLTVVGTKGRLVMDFEHITVETYEDSEAYAASSACINRQEMHFDAPVSADFPMTKPYHLMLNNFAEHILYGIPLIAPGEDGEHALEITAASYLSAWNREVIQLPVDDRRYQEELEQRIGMELQKEEA